MNEPAKGVLATTVRGWNRFVAEREKMEKAAHQVAEIVNKVIAEHLAYLKAQNINTSSEAMTLMGSPVEVVPDVEATYPTVKTMVHLRCAGATRSIIVNPNLSVSAGGVPIAIDQLTIGIPDQFAVNAAEFLRDAFLNAAKAATTKENLPEPAGSSMR